MAFRDWGTTLVQLTQDCGKLHVPSLLEPRDLKKYLDDVISDPLLQAAAIRGAYATPNDWLRAVERILSHEKAKTALDDPNKPLGKIARMAIEQYRADPRRHIAILTFNFDGLMEAALERQLGDEAKRVVVSVATAAELGGARQRPGICVYHLHGFLRKRVGNDSSLEAYIDNDIILDAYSYVRILAAPGNHWSWNCMNTFLFQKDCGAMFIGLSLLDPSLRLLLTQSAANGMPLSAVFVGKPLDPPLLADEPTALSVAWMMRDVQQMFDNLLEELSLIPYHVKEWSEVGRLLDEVRHDD
jgi:hypothetical protein